ncbi:MAG TPA: type I glutamate--ammonia ligase [Symbiobacteriaceae bacterium]|jgi:glutamine synthetase|nr:type I glutamate--ammonia ligase [Symbiobacteriaceae bacterium]
MTPHEVVELIRERGIKMIDVKFVDLPGVFHHLTVPTAVIDEDVLETGLPFDGSSIRGFRGIAESDMVLLPDLNTVVFDPFVEGPTLSMFADVKEPGLKDYARDPRGVAKRAESFLKNSGIADVSFWGPEIEFFMFDNVRFQSAAEASYYFIESGEAHWNFGRGDTPNSGYKVKYQQGYFRALPIDDQTNIRTAMSLQLEEMGFVIERHHHEVASAGQNEINFRFSTLVDAADKASMFKYVVKNVARAYGKTITFMPKPLWRNSGSGMHCNQSLSKDGRNLFYKEGGYANLSQEALWYIGGLLTHAPALLAITNPSTNSYKRLVPGYEAPVNLVFSKGNRSAAIRVPSNFASAKTTRVEFRTPDPTANPYLAFAAQLMAGLDGIRRQIDPTKAGFGPVDKDMYHLTAEEKAKISSAPTSLRAVVEALRADHEFLLEGGVFSKELIETWISLKEEEIATLDNRPHPVEFEMYFDI